MCLSAEKTPCSPGLDPLPLLPGDGNQGSKGGKENNSHTSETRSETLRRSDGRENIMELVLRYGLDSAALEGVSACVESPQQLDQEPDG